MIEIVNESSGVGHRRRGRFGVHTEHLCATRPGPGGNQVLLFHAVKMTDDNNVELLAVDGRQSGIETLGGRHGVTRIFENGVPRDQYSPGSANGKNRCLWPRRSACAWVVQGHCVYGPATGE